VRRVAQDLAVFSRTGSDDIKSVSLTRPLEMAMRLTHNTIRHRATLVRELQRTFPVLGNEAKITQLFVNLLLNAAQSIPEGASSAHQVKVSAETLPDRRACVTISDTGHGMSPEVIDRAFDPFFTTRERGVGMGLGLSVCHGIVTAMGGEITIESESGRGSVVRVVLPAALRAAKPSTITPVPYVHDGARCRVVLIDDDAMVCRSLERLLSSFHDVEVFTSPREALERLLTGSAFDVALCDVMMPEMSGIELYQRLATANAVLASRVVFVTGEVFSAEVWRFLEEGQHRVIEKPVSQETLQQVIQRVATLRA
jgi:CheY-like chemotaxis protein